MELHDNPQLLARFKAGEKDVLTDLYRAHVRAVSELLQKGFGFSSGKELVRFSGFHDPHKLQEMVQESFIRAFRQSSRDAYDGKRPYRPFLITIARNLVIDSFRRETLEKRLFVPMARLVGQDESEEDAVSRLQHAPEDSASPERAALRAELRVILDDFLKTLDDIDRRIVDEHLLGELSQREIADALACDRNDVRKRLRIMRERLLRHLKTTGYISELDPAELLQTLLVLCWRSS